MEATLTNELFNQTDSEIENLRAKRLLAEERFNEYTRLRDEAEKEMIALGLIDSMDCMEERPHVWMNLSDRPGRCPMLESYISCEDEDPVIRFAGMLEYELSNSVLKKFELQGLKVLSQQNEICFYISGSIPEKDFKKYINEFLKRNLKFYINTQEK